MNASLQNMVEYWVDHKMRLVEAVGLTNDAMHIHGSLLILFVAALVLRRRPDSIWCWLVVFVAELFNEYADLRGLAPGEATMDAALHDIYNTMFWPTVIVLFGRFLFPRKNLAEIKAPTSGDLPDQAFEKPTAI
nr:hypothetical protein [uncultured Sphingorhabdus sp.]